jgi:hypothetical protein
MATSAKSLQNINKFGIFNPGGCEVNLSNASAALASAGLRERPIYAEPAAIIQVSFWLRPAVEGLCGLRLLSWSKPTRAAVSVPPGPGPARRGVGYFF